MRYSALKIKSSLNTGPQWPVQRYPPLGGVVHWQHLSLPNTLMRKLFPHILFSFSLFSLLLLLNIPANAAQFTERPLAQFDRLNDYPSTAAFDKYIADYTQQCLDNSYGGSLAPRCFVGSQVWDRELNTYYQLLMQTLNKSGRQALRQSQRAWLLSRDRTMDFNHYVEAVNMQQGTIYIAMAAGDRDAAITPMIRHRALLLKRWLEAMTPSQP